jgi:hypothetical protein
LDTVFPAAFFGISVYTAQKVPYFQRRAQARKPVHTDFFQEIPYRGV